MSYSSNRNAADVRYSVPNLTSVYTKKELEEFHSYKQKLNTPPKKAGGLLNQLYSTTICTPLSQAWDYGEHLYRYRKLYTELFLYPIFCNLHYLFFIACLSVAEGIVLGLLSNTLGVLFRTAVLDRESLKLKGVEILTPFSDIILYVSGYYLNLFLITQLSNKLTKEYSHRLNELQTLQHALANFQDTQGNAAPLTSPQDLLTSAGNYSKMATFILLSFSAGITYITKHIADIVLFFQFSWANFNWHALAFILQEMIIKIGVEQALSLSLSTIKFVLKASIEGYISHTKRQLAKVENNLHANSNELITNAQLGRYLKTEHLTYEMTEENLRLKDELSFKVNLASFFLTTISKALSLISSLSSMITGQGDLYAMVGRFLTTHTIRSVKSQETSDVRDARKVPGRILSKYIPWANSLTTTVEYSDTVLQDRKQQLSTSLPENAPNILEINGVLMSPDGKSQLARIATPLAVPQGRMVALVGPSGSGKSLLVNRLTGSGLNNQENPENNLTIQIKPGVKVGSIPSSQLTTKAYTLRQYLEAQVPEFKILAESNNESEELGSILKQTMQAFKLEELYYNLDNNKPGSVSGGQWARFALMCQMLAGCKVLILDETLEKLDTESRAMCVMQIKAYNETVGASTIIITHGETDTEAETAWCTYIWCFEKTENAEAIIMQRTKDEYQEHAAQSRVIQAEEELKVDWVSTCTRLATTQTTLAA